jgi:hypothetical protein
VFSTEAYGGGGTFFTDGRYRAEEYRFVKYDFNGSAPGKDGNGITCLCGKLQPIDKNGKDAGEVAVQYWSVGDDVAIENKGHSISLAGDFPTIWALSDFSIFIEHLGTAGFDRDAMEEADDVGLLDGMVADYGKVPDPKTGGKERLNKKTGKPLPPKQIIVVTGNIELKGGKAASTSKGKAAEAEAGSDAETMLGSYLEQVVCIDKNEKKGVEKLQARMGINKFVKDNGGDSDLSKEVTALFGKADVLVSALAAFGWKTDGSKLVKE